MLVLEKFGTLVVCGRRRARGSREYDNSCSKHVGDEEHAEEHEDDLKNMLKSAVDRPILSLSCRTEFGVVGQSSNLYHHSLNPPGPSPVHVFQ